MTLSRRRFASLVAAGSSVAALPSWAETAPGPRIGAPAPTFSAVDSNGQTVSLAGLKGKTVVMEWTNDECPFVRKH